MISKVNTTQSDLQKLEEKVAIKTDVDKMEQRSTNLEEKINIIETNLGSKITNMQKRITNLEGNYNNQKSIINVLSENQTSTKSSKIS